MSGGTPVAAGPDGAVARRQLRLVAGAQVLAMATWFAATAVAPALREQWSVGPVGSTLLISAVQVGFVVGALGSAATNLPDRVHPPLLMAVGSCAAAVTTAALAVLPTGLPGAVVLRLLTGVALAAVYPVGMKLAVSWFDRGRGLAVGVLVGALTVGSTLPLLVSGLLGDAWRQALLVAAASAVLAALVLRGVRVGPLVSAATGLDTRAALQVLRTRDSRLAVLGYLGHMWELYALWVWAPLLVLASLRAAGEDPSGAQVGVLCFLTLGVLGLAGCVGAGRLGDRVGRARTAAGAMVLSGACCVVAALTFGAPAWVTVVLLAVWGPSVIADSALFSACLGSVVPRDHVGTALTLQTALGFLLTVVSIQLVPVVEAGLGWPVAVGLLAVGPLAGAVAMLRLPDPSRPVRTRRTAPTRSTTEETA